MKTENKNCILFLKIERICFSYFQLFYFRVILKYNYINIKNN